MPENSSINQNLRMKILLRIHVYWLLEEALNVEVDPHNEFHLPNVSELNLLLVLNENIDFIYQLISILPFACLINFCRSLNKLFSVRT
jgi:hypothetical protein